MDRNEFFKSLQERHVKKRLRDIIREKDPNVASMTDEDLDEEIELFKRSAFKIRLMCWFFCKAASLEFWIDFHKKK